MKKITLFALLAVLIQFMSLNTFSQWIEWEKLYFNRDYTSGYSVKSTSDNNYVIAGETYDGGFILKLDQNGDTLWVNRNAQGTSIVEIDGYYYTILAYYQTLHKLNQNGALIWSKNINFNDSTVRIYNVSKSADNKLLICGSSWGGFIGKLDTSGTYLWGKRLRGISGYCHNIKPIADNQYIVSGASNLQFYLAKISGNGNIIWERNYGTSNYSESAQSVFQTFDKGFLSFGFINFAQWNSKIYITKSDSSGNLLWSKIYGDTLYVIDNYYSDMAIKNKYRNEYVLVARKYHQTIYEDAGSYLVSFDSLGTKLWDRITYNSDSLEYSAYSVDQNIDSSFIVCGNAFNPPFKDSNPQYLYVFKTKKINPIGIINISSEIPNRFILHQNYPNPFNPITKIKIELPKSSDLEFNVFDILGRKIYSAYYNKPAGTYEIDFDGSGFASGIYFYSVKAGKYSDTKKMIILK
jgi:hypothetical protein